MTQGSKEKVALRSSINRITKTAKLKKIDFSIEEKKAQEDDLIAKTLTSRKTVKTFKNIHSGPN